MHSQLLPFVGTAIVIALTPGADTALVVRNALVAGAAPARRTALGTASGLTVWGAASACGVAAVLNASAEAYTRRWCRAPATSYVASRCAARSIASLGRC